MIEKEYKRESIKFSPEDLEKAQQGLERMSLKLNELMEKKKTIGLTEKEEREIAMIMHNVQPIIEIVSGEIPHEFAKEESEE